MKTVNFFLLILGFLAFAVSSCQSNVDAQGEIVDLSNLQNVTETELFQKVQVIALEDKEGKYLSNIQEMISEGDYLLLRDSKDVLFVYTKDGKYVADSKNKIGHGANEFSIINSWTYNRYTKNVEVVTPLHLLSYDLHFNLKNKVKLPTRVASKDSKSVMFGRIYDLSANLHILIPTLISQDAYTYLLFDSSSSNVIGKYDFESDVKAGINMQNQCFFENNTDNLGFVPPFMTQYVYSFNKKQKEFSKKYLLQFGKDVLSEEDIKKIGDNEEKKSSFLLNTDKEIPVSCFDTSGNVVVVMKKGRKLSDWFTLFYDKSSKQVARVNQFTDKKMSFPLVMYADNSCLYASVDDTTLDGILNHLKKQGVKLEVNKQEKGSSYVLKYYLK